MGERECIGLCNVAVIVKLTPQNLISSISFSDHLRGQCLYNNNIDGIKQNK